MQELKHGKLVDVPAIIAAHEACLIKIRFMCSSRRLQLNDNKTELFWFGTAVNLRNMASHTGDIRIGQSVVTLTLVVRDLGVLFDAELSMREHICKITQTCFYHLRKLRSVRHKLGHDVTARFVSAFVLSRLDYCNAVLAGLPASTLAPLQRVIHAAARTRAPSVAVWSRYHRSARLHWLPIIQRLDYKLCMLIPRFPLVPLPLYLTNLLTAYADIPSKAALRAYTSGDYVVPRTRLKLGERAFSVAAPLAWNRLSTPLNLCVAQTFSNVSLKLFRMTLHTTRSSEHWTSFSLLLSCVIGLFEGGALQVHVVIVIVIIEIAVAAVLKFKK